MERYNPIIEVMDDGLYIPEVRLWSEKKYRLLGAYCDIFTSSMKYKWTNLVYLDLFAGAGYAKIKETGKILKSSSLIAMSLPNAFSHYIFCEEDASCINPLKERVKREFPGKNVSFIEGDVNDNIDMVKSKIPQYSRGNTVLSFAFVDPFSLDLKFNTIARLGRELKIDFLILLAFGMDANRNEKIYLNKNNTKISNFLSDENWRNNYDSSQKFINFLADKYDQNMVNIGYEKPVEKNFIKSNEKNLPLYHLAFYSKNPLGNKFWKEIRSYGNQQYELKFK